MLTLATDNTAYRYSGAALIVAHLNLFVWGLIPFQGGVWVQTEPDMLALFILSALTALWLGIGIARGWLHGQPWHALWKWLALWIGLQLLVTALAPLPWKSWFGPAGTGEGAAWYVALSLIFITTHALWQQERLRNVILAAAVCALAITCLLHGLYPPGEVNLFNPTSWAPAQWPDYLGFVLGYLWLAVAGGYYGKQAIWYCTLIVLGYAALYVCESRAVVALLTPAMVTIVLMAAWQKPRALQRLLYPHRRWRMLAMAACVLPLAMVPFSARLIDWQDINNPHLVQGNFSQDGALGSRFGLKEVAVRAFEHEPLRWVVGKGWGGFSDDLFQYALIDGVYIYHNQARKPNWFAVNGDAFHSHSQPLEAMLSFGIFGLVLWYAWPLLLLHYLPRRYFWRAAPMLVALTLLGHLWFQLPQCVAFQAVGMAALTALYARTPAQPISRRYLPIALCGAVCVVMVWSAWQQRQAIAYGTWLRDAMQMAYVEDGDKRLSDDLHRGGERWRGAAQYFIAETMRRDVTDAPLPSDKGWLNAHLRVAHQAALMPTLGVRAAASELWMGYNVLGGLRSPTFADTRQRISLNLEESVMRVVQLAPHRDDFTGIFLINLADYTRGDVVRQVRILTNILTIAPEHRPALWMLGNIIQFVPGQNNDAQLMMRNAVALGLERVFPVTPAEIARYQSSGFSSKR